MGRPRRSRSGAGSRSGRRTGPSRRTPRDRCRPRPRRADRHLPLAARATGSRPRPRSTRRARSWATATTDDHNAPDCDGRRRPAPQPAAGDAGEPRGRVPDRGRSGTTQPAHRAGTEVRSLVITDGRATGVVARSEGGTTTYEAGEVILAAGAVGSPHLMLRAGVGPADDLRTLGIPVVADVPGMGGGVRDHPKSWTQWRLRDGLGLTRPGALAPTLGTLHRDRLRPGGDMMLYPNSVVAGSEPGTSTSGSRPSTTSSCRRVDCGCVRPIRMSSPASTSPSCPSPATVLGSRMPSIGPSHWAGSARCGSCSSG